MTANQPSTPRTAAASQARKQATGEALIRVRDTLTRLRRDKHPITVAAVARRATVSRTFLYTNQDAKQLLAEAITRSNTQQRQHTAADPNALQEATWRERALNAEDALKAANNEIRSQRTKMGELIGQIRDIEAEWTQESIQRITTENTTLKQQVRELTSGNRTLAERLQAARSNLRFQDRRIADLEAKLLETGALP
jgi:predicted transcriptional regulator